MLSKVGEEIKITVDNEVIKVRVISKSPKGYSVRMPDGRPFWIDKKDADSGKIPIEE
jgi:hypothetical protein